MHNMIFYFNPEPSGYVQFQYGIDVCYNMEKELFIYELIHFNESFFGSRSSILKTSDTKVLIKKLRECKAKCGKEKTFTIGLDIKTYTAFGPIPTEIKTDILVDFLEHLCADKELNLKEITLEIFNPVAEKWKSKTHQF